MEEIDIEAAAGSSGRPVRQIPDIARAELDVNADQPPKWADEGTVRRAQLPGGEIAAAPPQVSA